MPLESLLEVIKAGTQQKAYVESFTRAGSEVENKTYILFDKASLPRDDAATFGE